VILIISVSLSILSIFMINKLVWSRGLNKKVSI
jgi:hypothetical protein